MLTLDNEQLLELEQLRSLRDAAGTGEPVAGLPPLDTPFGEGKVGRNDPCPCGSGKKFKRCHGR